MFSFFIKQPSENIHIRILFKFLINIFNCKTEFIAGKIKKVDKSFCILYYYTNYSKTKDRTTKQKNFPFISVTITSEYHEKLSHRTQYVLGAS